VLAGATLTVSGTDTAEALADQARHSTGASLGMGLKTELGPSGGTYEGAVEIALTGAVTAVERFPMKSSYQEVQRRSALSAADLLRRTLVTNG
jgi:nicotinamide mononucleotide (NMN) deamidase PncC